MNRLLLVVADIDSVMNNTMSLAERLSLFIKIFLIGMGAVFVVLCIIWGAISFFRFLLKGATDVKKKTETITAPAISVPTPVSSAQEDDELIALITAAICTFRAGSGDTLPFRVVTYRKKSSASGWNKNYNS